MSRLMQLGPPGAPHTRASRRKNTDAASTAVNVAARRASLRGRAASAAASAAASTAPQVAVVARKRSKPRNQQSSNNVTSMGPAWPLLDHIPTVGETVGFSRRRGSAPSLGVVTHVRARIKLVDLTIGRTRYEDVGFAKLVDLSSDENSGIVARKRGKRTTPRAAQTPVAADQVPAAQRAVVTTARRSASTSGALLTLRAAQERKSRKTRTAKEGSGAVSFAPSAAEPSDPSVCTMSNPFDRAFMMMDAADRLDNVAELINSLHHTLERGAVVQASDVRKMRVIANALPLIAAVVVKGARRSAPSASASEYAHRRIEREAERASGADELSALARLEAHNTAASAATSASSTRGGRPRSATGGSRRKKRRAAVANSRKVVLSSTVTVTLRDPDNGSKYTPAEVVSYFASSRKLPRGSKKKIFATMSNLGFVAVEENALYKVVAKAEAGQPVPASFNKSGRPSIAAVAAIQAFTAKQTATGNRLDAPKMKAHLTKLRRGTLEAAGFAPTDEQCTPSDMTVKNYLAIAATKNNMRVQKLEHVHDKTRRRYIAEHSIRGALSWLYTMAHTHFIIGVAPPGRTRRNDPLVKLIENAAGVPVYSVSPELILNADDTTLFAGSTNTKKDFSWVLVSGKHPGHVRSPFSTDGVAFQSGARRALRVIVLCVAVKGSIPLLHSTNLLHSFPTPPLQSHSVRYTALGNAVGNAAPMVMTMLGLTLHELPMTAHPSGIFALKVNGFNTASSTDLRMRTVPGYVVFVREGVPEWQLFEWFDQEITTKFVDEIRESMGWIPGTPVPQHLTSCLATDGAGPQLFATTTPEMAARDLIRKQRREKTDAAATTVRQPWDLASCFRTM